jgi:hypothetical protein
MPKWTCTIHDVQGDDLESFTDHYVEYKAEYPHLGSASSEDWEKDHAAGWMPDGNTHPEISRFDPEHPDRKKGMAYE